ncbi:MAG TPA: alpha-xenorhabdolysin family binary toxin subunit A [Symbiobacteriaceae bacterium]|nr:alpha-xenorhabdolysin family binary toxin subunit A [Symbiobacteriaceae bacterium]
MAPIDLTARRFGNEQSPYLLSSADWNKVHAFAQGGLRLPTDEGPLRQYIGYGGPDFGPFNPLLDTYRSIKNRAAQWRDGLFGQVIGMADGIVQYAGTTTQSYNGLRPVILQLLNAPTPELQAEFERQIAPLAATAQRMADQAGATAQAVVDYSKGASADHDRLIQIINHYNWQFGQTQDQMNDRYRQLEAERHRLEGKIEEYKQAVIVAATTPTYAWIPIIGWIAGGVVAGVYGDKAVKAKAEAEAARDQIVRLQEQVARDRALLDAIQRGQQITGTVDASLAAALPVIQRMEGVWRAFAADLTNVTRLVKEDLAQADPILRDFVTDEALLGWQKLGQAAAEYRQNADAQFRAIVLAA